MPENFDRVYEESLEYFSGDELAASVFATKYALQDGHGNFLETDPDQMHRRLAQEFARIERKYDNPMSEEEIYGLLKDFKYVVPQGSPMSGIGNTYQIQSLSNCFVVEPPQDSYGGILKTDQEQVQIMKRRGGVGFDISTIRPQGMRTSNAAKTTDGIGVFMERFSNSCREVAQGGRRGALMLTLSVHHPDIRTFIHIKRNLKKVTGANISVRLSDEFMNAVDRAEDYELRFPVDPSDERIFSERISARELWDEIIESAHTSAEPGLLFWDNVLNYTPAQIYKDDGFDTISTNPCSEITLSAYDSCRLLLLNLTSFVTKPFTKSARFDYEIFAEKTMQAQRLMDDLIDLEIECVDRILQKLVADPEEHDVKRVEIDLWKNIRHAALQGRRTGLGVTGLGDTLAMLGLKYGSKKSIRETETIYKQLALAAYKSSCFLARERGAFPVYDFRKEEGHPFIKRLFQESSELRNLHRTHGRRNIALTTTAPCGSVSTLTQTTSGIEPAFMLKYKRRKKINLNDPNATADFIDDLGDKWQEFDVYHHGVRKWMEITEQSDVEESPYFGATANEIDWESAVDLQAAAQKWVCHAISKTINLPSDASVEDVKKVYWRGWKKGLKGVTVYRDGCRSGVLVADTDGETRQFQTHKAPKRSSSLECEIHHTTIQGQAWTILVGLMDDRPYEIMGGLRQYIEIPRKYKFGELVKIPYKSKDSRYDLVVGNDGDQLVIKDIVRMFDNPNHSAFTRTISLALRHGAHIQYVVEQLQKDREADMFSFAKVVARVLKKYIANGTKASTHTCENCSTDGSLVYQEGCVMCTSCGHGKCG
jgi:ribonucleoside-diphosphate reductase alpha chain